MDTLGTPILRGSRCAVCCTVAYPVNTVCARCALPTTTPLQLSSTGIVWAYTVQRFAPKSPPYVPPAHGFSSRSRIEIDQIRLLVLKASWLMDTQGNAAARSEVAAIKVAAMEVAHAVVDRAVQIHGAAGVSNDTVLARLYAITRALQIADGPNEIHLRTIARLEVKKYR